MKFLLFLFALMFIVPLMLVVVAGLTVGALSISISTLLSGKLCFSRTLPARTSFLLLFILCGLVTANAGPLLPAGLDKAAPLGVVPAARQVLADAAPPGAHEWLNNLGWFLGILTSLGAFVLGRKTNATISPTPFPIVQGQRFADHDHTKEALADIKETLKQLSASLGQYGSAQYKARARMHQKLNAMSNALHFLAGEMLARGDKNGERLRQMLEPLNAAHTGGDDE